MRYGIREICNVVFKATVDGQRIGRSVFSAGAPVIYFDSLKTSTMEQATTTVYAQGGRGNTRLVAWEGEKTLTFTMEDALISEMGIAILAGANLFKDSANGTSPSDEDALLVHVTEIITGGEGAKASKAGTANTDVKAYALALNATTGEVEGEPKVITIGEAGAITGLGAGQYLIDYYIDAPANTIQIDIEPQSFGGNFYIEADTLFRDSLGKDHAAQFIIPNGKVQSNFTFTMASSGDPSTFTFTVDAFPGYVNGDKSKKVLSAIQIVGDDDMTTILDPAGDKGTEGGEDTNIPVVG